MALVKDMVIDLIQVLSDRQIQIREVRRVVDTVTGEVVATGAYHRFVLDPGTDTIAKVRATFDADVANAVDAFWTPTVIAARKAFLAEQEAIRLLRFQQAGGV